MRRFGLRPIDISIINVSFITYTEANKMTAIDAQKIIDFILKKLGLFSSTLTQYSLYNNWTLSISENFSKHQGHELEKLYKTEFPFLKSYHREDELKKDIINKVIDDYPQYAPNELFKIIKKIK